MQPRSDPVKAKALRILHIGKFFPPDVGGMETFLADLVHAQRAQGIDAHALVHGQATATDPDWLTRVPVQLQLVYAPLALGWLGALRQAITRLRPDVLHLHMPNLGVFHALLLPQARALPWVVHWHSDVVVSPRSPLALRLAYFFYRPFEQAVLEQAHGIVCTSPTYLQASQALERWRHKALVVPLGITTETPSTQANDLPANWQNGHLRLLSMGRLAHYKGFDTLIKAVSQTPEVHLIIAGQGEQMGQLQALLSQLPASAQSRITLTGRVSEAGKHALLASCDLFALASTERTEAFGMVLLEAMAHGKPCLVSQLPGSGMPWLVNQAQAGWHDLQPDDAPAWSARLQSLAPQKALLHQTGQQGLQSLRQQFDIHTIAHQLGHIAGHIGQRSQTWPDRPSATPTAADVLIVIPARDEAATIAQVVTTLRTLGWTQLVVIDDQSQDDTAALARAAGARVLQPALPLGAWGSMQLGIRMAVQEGYQAVITMDADGQHEAREIPHLLAHATQSDVVIGAHPQRVSPLRLLAWRWFRTLSGFTLEDLTSGFRYYNARAMQLLADEEASLIDYQDIGVLLLIRRAGLDIREVPVSMNARSAGRSRIFYSWFSVLRYMLTTTLLCLARWGQRHRHQR